MILREISFDEILPIWKYYLWPERTTTIQPMSSMLFLGETDIKIYDKYKARFCAVEHQGQIIGVNSCHQSGPDHMRSRGIYVDPKFRRHGVSKLLFDFVKKYAAESECELIWSLPRLSALPAYLGNGFEICGEVINYGVEYGPNVYVALRL